jgi:hypothetical protein
MGEFGIGLTIMMVLGFIGAGAMGIYFYSSVFIAAKERFRGDYSRSFSGSNPITYQKPFKAGPLKIYPDEIEYENRRYKWDEIRAVKCKVKKTITNGNLKTYEIELKIVVLVEGNEKLLWISNWNQWSKQLMAAYGLIFEKVGHRITPDQDLSQLQQYVMGG